MKKTALALALTTLAAGSVSAHETSHWRNSSGELVKNSSGECVRTINHSEDADSADCHGGAVKRQIPKPVPVVDNMAEKRKAMEEEARRRAEAAKKAAMAKTTETKKALESIRNISLGSGASFNTGSATLSSAGKAELNSLAAKIKQVGDGLKSVQIEGHTDSSGSAAFNQRLSQKRADAVKSYLADQGIDASKITAKGYGESQPVATNETSAGRAENRRVSVKVDGDIVEAVSQ